MTINLATFLLATTADATGRSGAAAADSDDDGRWDGNCRLNLRRRFRQFMARKRGDRCDSCIQGAGKMMEEMREMVPFSRASTGDVSTVDCRDADGGGLSAASTGASSSSSSSSGAASPAPAAEASSSSSSSPAATPTGDDDVHDDRNFWYNHWAPEGAAVADPIDDHMIGEFLSASSSSDAAPSSLAPPPLSDVAAACHQPCGVDCGAQHADAEEEVCPICYDDDCSDEEDCWLELCDRRHRMHAKCAVRYLSTMQKEVCPLCNVPETNFLTHCEAKLTPAQINSVENGHKVGRLLLQHKARELQRLANTMPTAEDLARIREMEYNHATQEELLAARQDNTLLQLQRNLARRQELVAAQAATPMPPRDQWRTLSGRMKKKITTDAYFKKFKKEVDNMGPHDVVLEAITTGVPLDLAPLEVIKEEYAKLAREYQLDERYNEMARWSINGHQPRGVAEEEGDGFQYELVAREGNVVLPYVTVSKYKQPYPARLTNSGGHTGLVWGSDALDDQDPIFTFCVLKRDPRTQQYKVTFNSYDYEHPDRYPFPGGLPNQQFPVFAEWATGSNVTRELHAYTDKRAGFVLENQMDAQWYINSMVGQRIAERLARERAEGALAATVTAAA